MYWYTNKWEEGTKIQTNFGGAVYKLEEGNSKLIMYAQTNYVYTNFEVGLLTSLLWIWVNWSYNYIAENLDNYAL